MRIETIAEQRARVLEEMKDRRVPGRTLPRGVQWNGLDQPGCGAAKRRLRQAERLAAKKQRLADRDNVQNANFDPNEDANDRACFDMGDSGDR